MWLIVSKYTELTQVLGLVWVIQLADNHTTRSRTDGDATPQPCIWMCNLDILPGEFLLCIHNVKLKWRNALHIHLQNLGRKLKLTFLTKLFWNMYMYVNFILCRPKILHLAKYKICLHLIWSTYPHFHIINKMQRPFNDRLKNMNDFMTSQPTKDTWWKTTLGLHINSIFLHL